MTFQPTRPSSYEGVRAATPINLWTRARDPNFQDLRLYVIGDLWYNRVIAKFWILIDTGAFGALWVPLTSSAAAGILTINGLSPTALGDFTLVAGANITITPGVNSATISAGGTGNVTWNLIAVNTLALVNNGYMANAGAPITVTLLPVFAFGEIVYVKDFAGGSVVVAPSAGDSIVFNNQLVVTTITSSGITPALQFIGSIANTRWDVLSSQGNWDIP